MDRKDNLEEFIKKNREAFDSEKAPEFDWEVLKKPKAKKAKFRTLKFIALAASLSLLVGIFFFSKQYQNTSGNDFADSELSKELPELKNYYSSQVANKFAELEKYNTDPSLAEDIKQMDDFLKDLEEELKAVPPSKRDEVIEAMIKNYQYKVFMLDKVLNQIKKTSKEHSDDTINI